MRDKERIKGSVRQRERRCAREIQGGERAQREILASNAVVLAYALATAVLALASQAVCNTARGNPTAFQ